MGPIIGSRLQLKLFIQRNSFVVNFYRKMSDGGRIPSRPFSFFETDDVSSSGAKRLKPSPTAPVDLSSINRELLKVDEMRNQYTQLALALKLETLDARRKLLNNTYSSAVDKANFEPLLLQIQLCHESNKEQTDALTATSFSDSSNTNFQLSNRLEDYARFKAFDHFLSTGTLISPGAFNLPTTSSTTSNPLLSDEEYLTGAVMGLTDELSRYVLGRAIVRDISSVILAKSMVDKILDYLLSFDFRNGYLRRKYDGVKYALKSCEQVVYELSVINTNESLPKEINNHDDMLPMDALIDLRKRIEHKDNIREALIKSCRDAQKVAKQAIFAVHRAEYSRAAKFIRDCETMICKTLLPMTMEDPTLRSGGSLSAVIEEYLEAKLFFIWLHGPTSLDDSTWAVADNTNTRMSVTHACGTILQPLEFPFTIRPDEYLGALSDVTGEIGRFAVHRATARDAIGVTICLETCSAIVHSIESLHRYPFGYGKKIDQLKKNVDKLERTLYELSLTQATGRTFAPKDFTSHEPDESSKRDSSYTDELK